MRKKLAYVTVETCERCAKLQRQIKAERDRFARLRNTYEAIISALKKGQQLSLPRTDTAFLHEKKGSPCPTCGKHESTFCSDAFHADPPWREEKGQQ